MAKLNASGEKLGDPRQVPRSYQARFFGRRFPQASRAQEDQYGLGNRSLGGFGIYRVPTASTQTAWSTCMFAIARPGSVLHYNERRWNLSLEAVVSRPF